MQCAALYCTVLHVLHGVAVCSLCWVALSFLVCWKLSARKVSATQHTEHIATLCNTLQHSVIQCNTLQHTATHCNTLQHSATSNQVLETQCQETQCHPTQRTHCNTMQHAATQCSTVQHTATHYNTLQHKIVCWKLSARKFSATHHTRGWVGRWETQCLGTSVH